MKKTAIGTLIIFCFIIIGATSVYGLNTGKSLRYDVVVVGSTPGGVAAAVNAAREGVTVSLLQGDGHIGGLASGGQSNPDFRSFESLGGTYREYMQRVENTTSILMGRTPDRLSAASKGGMRSRVSPEWCLKTCWRRRECMYCSGIASSQ